MPSIADLEVQALETPLNEGSRQALQDLSQDKTSNKRLQDRLAKAIAKLTEGAAQINDRAQEERTRHHKKLQRLQATGVEENDGERKDYAEFQSQVEILTGKMDHSIRAVIDDQIWLEGVSTAINHVAGKVAAASQATQQTNGPIPISTQRYRLEDEEMEEVDGSDQEAEAPAEVEAPTALLHTTLETQAATWQAKSLTDRYAYNNDYTGFYRVIHDAKNPGEDAPLIPDASLWFAEEEGRQLPSTTQRGLEDSEDEGSDVEIASERVRVTCPITLLPFQDPVTSTKCVHSFEKAAILGMLKTSTLQAPWTTEEESELSQLGTRDRPRRERQLRTPQVKCPECNVPLGETELRPNPVLLRKTNRFLEAERRRNKLATSDVDEDEDGEDDDGHGLPRGSQRRPVGLTSSPAPGRLSGMINLKRERVASMVPQTQLPGAQKAFQSRSVVLDLDDQEDE